MVTPAPKECRCGGFRFKNYTNSTGVVVPDKLVCQECGEIYMLTKPYWINCGKSITPGDPDEISSAIENKRHHDECEIWKDAK